MSRSRPAASRCPRSKTSFPASGAPSSNIIFDIPSCATACPTQCRSAASTPRRCATRCRPAGLADQVVQRFLRALRVVGGTPRPMRAGEALADRAPEKVSQTFSYYAPGQIRSGTGFRGKGGRAGLHGLFANPLPARGSAGLCRAPSMFHRGPQHPHLRPERHPAGADRAKPLARQFLRTPRLLGEPVPRRHRPSGPGHAAADLPARAELATAATRRATWSRLATA